MTEAEVILNLARDAGAKIATAESCTGGMIFAALTDIAGSSDVMERGFVTYSNEAKTEMLGVPAASIALHGAVSEPEAIAMAEGALSRSKAALAVSVTGVAGPGASERKPEGRVCFALARTGAPTHVETVDFNAIGRSGVRSKSTEFALSLIKSALSRSA